MIRPRSKDTFSRHTFGPPQRAAFCRGTRVILEFDDQRDGAFAVAPLDRLALATQGGFASSVGGNPVSEEDEEAKLARIVEVAKEVWGD